MNSFFSIIFVFQTTNLINNEFTPLSIFVILKVIRKHGCCQAHQLLVFYQFGMFDIFFMFGFYLRLNLVAMWLMILSVML